MGDGRIGYYRSELDDIDTLKMNHYDRIFKVYKYTLDNKDFNVYNMMKKLDFGDIDGEFVDSTEIVSDTPLPIIAYNLYSDIKLWWVVYLCNVEVFGGEAPFVVKGSTEIKYIKPEYITLIHDDITDQTIYDNRHY